MDRELLRRVSSEGDPDTVAAISELVVARMPAAEGGAQAAACLRAASYLYQKTGRDLGFGYDYTAATFVEFLREAASLIERTSSPETRALIKQFEASPVVGKDKP